MRRVVSPRTIVLLSAGLLLISFLIIGTTTTLTVVVLGALIYGLSEGFFIPMLQDVNMEDAPDEHRAVVIAVWVGFARLGQTIGPLLAALAVGAFGTGGAFIAGGAIALSILALGFFGPFPRTARGRLPAADSAG